jgi:restriction endonuclease
MIRYATVRYGVVDKIGLHTVIMGQIIRKFLNASSNASESSSTSISSSSTSVSKSLIKSLISISKKNKIKLEQRTETTMSTLWRQTIKGKLLKIQKDHGDYFNQIRAEIENNSKIYFETLKTTLLL